MIVNMINDKIKRFKIIHLIIAAFMCITFFYVMNRYGIIEAKKNSNYAGNTYKYLDNNVDVRRVKVISHRARYFGEPENSIHAIEDSIKYKVDYAEIDVQETKDGIVVLMHDKNLKRMTGLNESVGVVDFNQIEKLNIAPRYSSQHKEERIPTLDEAVKKSKGKLKLIIEIKPYGDTNDLTKKVVSIIEKNNFENQCMIHSMNYKILLNVKRLNPRIKTGYIACRPRKDLALLKVDFYSVQQRIITRKLVIEIHKSNRRIYSWTVDKPKYMDSMLKLNVDGIITDKPSILMNIKKGIRI